MDEAVKAKFEQVEAENTRQNHRIDELESEVKAIHEIAASIKELTIEIKHMREEVQAQGARLTKIENAPIEGLKGAKTTAVNTAVGVIIGALVGSMIMIMAQQIPG